MAKAKAKKRIFTVYDLMDFRDNEHKEYPKILYHPTGEEEILTHGNIENTVYGPELRNQQTTVKSRTVRNKAEEEEAIAAGWHLAKADAIAKRPTPTPEPRQPMQQQRLR